MGVGDILILRNFYIKNIIAHIQVSLVNNCSSDIVTNIIRHTYFYCEFLDIIFVRKFQKLIFTSGRDKL